MKNDLSPSDFAGLERQHAWFAELHSKIGDNQEDDGNIIKGLRWALVLTIIVAAGIGAFWWLS